VSCSPALLLLAILSLSGIIYVSYNYNDLRPAPRCHAGSHESKWSFMVIMLEWTYPLSPSPPSNKMFCPQLTIIKNRRIREGMGKNNSPIHLCSSHLKQSNYILQSHAVEMKPSAYLSIIHICIVKISSLPINKGGLSRLLNLVRSRNSICSLNSPSFPTAKMPPHPIHSSKMHQPSYLSW